MLRCASWIPSGAGFLDRSLSPLVPTAVLTAAIWRYREAKDDGQQGWSLVVTASANEGL